MEQTTATRTDAITVSIYSELHVENLSVLSVMSVMSDCNVTQVLCIIHSMYVQSFTSIRPTPVSDVDYIAINSSNQLLFQSPTGSPSVSLQSALATVSVSRLAATSHLSTRINNKFSCCRETARCSASFLERIQYDG